MPLFIRDVQRNLYSKYYKVTEMREVPRDPRRRKRAYEKASIPAIFVVLATLCALTWIPALLFGARIDGVWWHRLIPGFGTWWMYLYDQAHFKNEAVAQQVHNTFLLTKIIAFTILIAGGWYCYRIWDRWLLDERGLSNELGSDRWAYPEDLLAPEKEDDRLLPSDYDIHRGFGHASKSAALATDTLSRELAADRSQKAIEAKLAESIKKDAANRISAGTSFDEKSAKQHFDAWKEVTTQEGTRDPDAILLERPEIVEERRHLPRDLAYPEFFERNQNFYDAVEKIRPGYIIGNYRNPYRNGESVSLVDRSDRFISLMIPTRGGKGISFSFPNALAWEHSLFLNDPKKELCAATAWYRKYVLGQRIFIVEPFATDGRNARWNPLTEVRLGTLYEVTDAQAIADAICDPSGVGYDSNDSGTWRKRARTLMTAVILHILYSDEPEKSLRTVDSYFSDPLTLVGEKYQTMKKTVHDKLGIMGWTINGRPTRVHPVVAMAIQDQIDRPPGEAGSTKSEMQSFTEQYRNPTLGDNTAFSDFSMADLTDASVPSTVYFVVTPDTMQIAATYMRLFVTLLVNRNVGPLDFTIEGRIIRPHRWSLGLLLDEFVSTMGRLDTLSRAFSFIAGYNIRPAIILQGHGQLMSAYGDEAQNIDANMHTLAFGATNDGNSRKFFSEMLGNRTIAELHKSPMGREIRKSAVPLLSESEAGRIPMDEAVLMRAHEYPIPIKKLAYYRDDSAFASRVRRTDFASDRIPPEHQITFRQRERLHQEYLESVVRNKGTSPTRIQDTVSASDQNEVAQKALLERRAAEQADAPAKESSTPPASGGTSIQTSTSATAVAEPKPDDGLQSIGNDQPSGPRTYDDPAAFAKRIRELRRGLNVENYDSDDDEAA